MVWARYDVVRGNGKSLCGTTGGHINIVRCLTGKCERIYDLDDHDTGLNVRNGSQKYVNTKAGRSYSAGDRNWHRIH